MISRVHSSILQGIDAVAGEVEADVARGGLGELKLVGLAETAVKESVSRIQAALRNSGYRWPGPKVTINLAPADVKKDSAAFDLPIALAVMQAGAMFASETCDDFLVVGELALDGRVRAVKGALATAMLALRLGKRGLICPADNTAEAAVVDGIEVIGVSFLTQAVGFLTGELPIDAANVDLGEVFKTAGRYEVDFSDVRGQESAKRALTVAAAGHHNILMIGPPGAGKTMLAKRIPTVLPSLTPDESLETTRIYSARGLLAPGQSLMATRPVRMPHHSTSSAALVGGGVIPQPGEISLAHHGVLFLDELPEFTRTTLEMIRQPLEDRWVTIPRVHSTLKFPAAIMLVAAMNPCPCGYFTDPKRPCKCSPTAIERYLSRISGPLIDRIDIHIEVPPVPWRQLRGGSDGLSSAEMRQHVERARNVQHRRFATDSSQEAAAGSQEKQDTSLQPSSTITNATMSSRQIRQFCKLDSAGETLLKQAMTELGLSARAHDKVLRIARTIADIEEAENIKSHHLAEAIQYRRLDRRL
ncbi:MAG: YifB family Mg chelatase-like AAA ATPase [Planctomycetota bacterium]|nr:YifB family Mg chelatase-like AAA ATPase [Planctomycetota bacterium]